MRRISLKTVEAIEGLWWRELSNEEIAAYLGLKVPTVEYVLRTRSETLSPNPWRPAKVTVDSGIIDQKVLPVKATL